MTRRAQLFSASLAGLILAIVGVLPAAAGLMLWQTNSEGDDIHIFDVESKTLVRQLVVGPQPHGIAAPADSSVVFVALEANGRTRGELLWITPSRKQAVSP